MDLETQLDARLWKAIETSYQNRDYTAAILDSIHFVSQLIRDRAGLESDGQALAGEAFGGKNPKLKVNALQTESDWNVQKGVEGLLRGIYQAIRNPRSHGKFADGHKDAEALVLFLNFLVRTIEQAKSPFEKSAFLERVCDDPDFPIDNERYAELLAEEVPKGKKLDILIEVYNRRTNDNASRLRKFFEAVSKHLSADDLGQFFSIVSENLKTVLDESEIRSTIQMIPEEYWRSFDEVARLRIESKLIKSVRSGKYNSTSKKFLSGSLGTWIGRLIPYLELSGQLGWVLTAKLE